MPESAFKGTVKEGFERRFTVINERDFQRYVPVQARKDFEAEFNNISGWIGYGREKEGKNPFNNYLIINLDEPYIEDVIEVMKANGHWEGKTKDTREYFVVFEQFDPIRVKVDWDVNLPNNPDHDQLLQLWITENYGPVADYQYWELSTTDKHRI